MTIGGTTIDPFFGYGTGSAAASSPYAGTGVTSGDVSSQPYLDAYEAMMEGYEQQRASVFGDVMTDGAVTTPRMDATSAYRQMRELQEEQMNYNLRQSEQFRLNQAEAMSKDNSMTFAAQTLQMKIAGDEQAQIYPAFMEFVRAYKAACDPEGKMDQQTLVASACAKYQELTGNNLLLDIKNNSSGPLMSSFWRAATFGLCGNKQSSDETIAQITGQEVSESSKNMQKIGHTAGSTAGWAAGGAVVGGILGGVFGCGGGAVPGAAIGAKIGAGIGFVVGLLGSIF